MKKDFAVYLGLLLAGLGSAYYVSLPKEESSSNTVEWKKVEPSQVAKVVFLGEDKQVELVKRGEGFWAHYTEKKEVQANPHGKKNKNKDKETAKEFKTEVSQFRVSEKMDAILDSLNPLKAQRNLGQAKDLDLEEFELADPKQTFVVHDDANPILTLKVGKRAYGTRNYFVLDQQAQTVLLIEGASIDDVIKAKSRLYEHKFFGDDIDDFVGASIRIGENQKEMDHTKKDGAGKLLWTDVGEDSKEGKASYKSLMTKIEKLKVQTYADEEQLARLQVAVPFAEVELKKKSGSTKLQFVRLNEGEKVTYWVNSSFTGGFGRVMDATGESLAKDLPSVLLN